MNHDLSCLATGVGSLPHTSSEEACNLILNNLQEIPFWPQLPNLSFMENMYAQFSYLLPGTVIDEANKRVYIDTAVRSDIIEDFLNQIFKENLDYFAYDGKYFHGLYEIQRDEGRLKDIKILKGQITGPISLGFQITDENRKPIIYHDIYRDILIKNLKLMAKWQENFLRKLCDRTMIFLDEPYLSMIGSAFISIDHDKAIEYMNEVLSGIDGIKAIHCCGNTDWSLVLKTNIDVINFDAYNYSDNLFLYADDVIALLRRGGIIAWGIIPTNEEDLGKENVDSLTEKLVKDMEILAMKGIEMEDLLRSSIITPSCGLGPATVDCANSALPLLRDVSKKMREKYGL